MSNPWDNDTIKTPTTSPSAATTPKAVQETAPTPAPSDSIYTKDTIKGLFEEFMQSYNKPDTSPVSENPDRQFYQSTVPVEQRVFSGEAYTVKSGDTLSGIAADNPFTLKELIAANEGLDPAKLAVGQELKFPTGGTTPKTQTEAPVDVAKVEKAKTSEQVTTAVAQSVPKEAADNPLEYIFNKGYIGLDENNKEQQATIAGFLNNAVPNFVTDNSQVTKSSKAWCGAFADHVLENLGAARLETGDRYDKLRAAKYLSYGEDVGGVSNAKAGDLVVIKSQTGWHVSFFAGLNEKGDVLALGGNQGNSVKVSAYPANRVRGVRRIENVGSMDPDVLKEITSDIAETSGESTR